MPSKPIVLALAGDTMLGRGVAAEIDGGHRARLFGAELKSVLREADLFILNLECCLSRGGSRWPAPGKPFFFRAPPEAADVLAGLGVDCVTLANNHALDFGREALLDTLEHLARVDIHAVGAGADLASARAPVVLECGGFRLGVVAFSDHPGDFAAGVDQPGIAFADIRSGDVPSWLLETLASAGNSADAVLLSPHWGPNLATRPTRPVRNAAAVLGPRATLVAGHSAHVFHGVERNVLYDLGDLINDYASARPPRNLAAGVVHKLRKEIAGIYADTAGAARRRSGKPAANGNGNLTLWQQQRRRVIHISRMFRARATRSDRGLLFLVTLHRNGPSRLEVLPLKLRRCRTELASGTEAAYAHRRFRKICAGLGTAVERAGDRSVIRWT